MEYKDVSHEILSFLVIPEDVDVSTFNVISKKEISKDLEIGILGSSHYIKFKGPEGKTWTEIFTCEEIPNYLKEISNNSEYIHEVNKIRLDSSSSNIIYEGILRDSEMKFRFPGKSYGKFKPYTAIKVEGEGPYSIETIHVYPEEKVLIHTKSKTNVEIHLKQTI